MALTDTKKATLAYCLINTPDILINDEKRRLMYRMGVIDTSKDFETACNEIDLAMTYDDIPINEKIIEIEILRNDEDIDKLYQKVKECREYMKQNYFNN